MSNKKNLLNESQIRQFMKLAKLEPLTPGFVNGLTERGAETAPKEELDELRTGRTGALGPKGGTANPGHGRGQGEAADGSMFEAAPVGELEDDAADDLAGGSPEEDEEAAVDLEKVGDEEADVAVDAVEAEEAPSEEEVLAALQVIARAAGVEGLEMDVESTGEPSVEDELGPEPEDEFAPEGEDVVADLEVGEEEEALEEILGFGKSRADKAREKLALGKKKSYAPDAEAGEKSSAPTPEEIAAAQKEPRSKRPRQSAGDIAGRLGGSWKGISEGENTDDLVEQITKRVAARILKSALSKK